MINYGGYTCIRASELYESGVMSKANYEALAKRRKLNVVRRGGGPGTPALVEWDSIPERFRMRLMETNPMDGDSRLIEYIKANYEYDREAVAYFAADTRLSADKVREYSTEASILNCVRGLYRKAEASQRMMGGSFSWGQMAKCIEILRSEYPSNLPTSDRRFKQKYLRYCKEGYGALIEGTIGNENRRKVSAELERLIVMIACMPNKPFAKDVLGIFESFMAGETDIVDTDTGELMERTAYVDRQGRPLTLGLTTVASIMNQPRNRTLISAKTMGRTTFYHNVMPHVHRSRPMYAFSQITFDDRDLPRKLKDTRLRPKAYYAYDCASQACVGYAYNRLKTRDLVVDMFRNMFGLIIRNGWNCPAEVEVENHLMSQWRESFLKAGEVFPFVHFCAAQNSQEKYAEALNNSKKYTIEHKNHTGIGRFYAINPRKRTESLKVSDETNEVYEEPQYYSWDQLIEEDIRDIEEYNNSPHPDQKRYPGKTRWQVLVENMNPDLKPLNKPFIARYIGHEVETSIRRDSYCRVMCEEWAISGPEVLERLEPNNVRVTAYCLTGDDGKPYEVHIYQGENYIDSLKKIERFNRAKAEQTDADREAYQSQMATIKHYEKWLKENMPGTAAVVDNSATDNNGQWTMDAEAEILPDTPEDPDDRYDDDDDYSARALRDL